MYALISGWQRRSVGRRASKDDLLELVDTQDLENKSVATDSAAAVEGGWCRTIVTRRCASWLSQESDLEIRAI